jgi:transposase
VFYRWQKELFENAAIGFRDRSKPKDRTNRKMERKLESLESKVAKKDAVIAELLEDHIRLKKTLGEA